MSVANTALAVDDGQGRDWRPLTETTFLSRAQVAAVCPTDGLTPCTTGTSIDLDEWTWATAPQVVELFGQYVPSFATAPNWTVSGFEYEAAASLFMSHFGLTTNLSGCSTYQGCFFFQQTAGHSASNNELGQPIGGIVQPSGFFTVAPFALNESVARGHFLWRATGKDNGTVHAYNDKGRSNSPLGGTAISNVLANDYAAGVRATTSNIALSLVGNAPAGLSLDTLDGSVDVAAGTAVGTFSLTYQICLLANLAICDDARATVTVPSFPIVAVADSGRVAFKAGGIAVANVLANDTVGGLRATLALVNLSVVSTTAAGISLDVNTGGVSVAPSTTHGNHSLVYRICEKANPVNCAQATVTVGPHLIDAVNDSYRLSSKVAVTSPSVFNNDWFNGTRPTSAVIQASIVGTLPYGVLFNSVTGSLYTRGKVSSGTYLITYKICELASLDNCDQAAVTLDLSGR